MENKELIKRAVDYAMAHAVDEDITVQAVAEHAGFSIDYFNRLFLSHTGFTVMAYVGYRRLKQAIMLLRNTDKSVLDIALEVGYSSHEGFIKAFKKEYGVTPSDYRRQHQEKVLSYGELADRSVTARFLHDNPDFAVVSAEDAIDYWLERDSKRHAYRCTGIHAMGFGVVAPNGDVNKGIICIGDDRQGGYWLELVTDDTDTLCEWLTRFDRIHSFDSALAPDDMTQVLKARGVEITVSATPERLYFGEPLTCELPQDVTVRPLAYSDKEAVLAFANGNLTPYIHHLLREQDYLDERVLDYGVFQGETLIAVMGGGIEEVRGLRLNNCCQFYTGDTPLSDALYRAVYAAATNDLLSRGILPFDDVQHGDFARKHGNFTTADLGFEAVNYRYKIG